MTSIPLAIVQQLAHEIGGADEYSTHGKNLYRAELIRRLRLRGWYVRAGLRLEPGSRGDDTYRRGTLDLLATPPTRPDPDNPDTQAPICDPPVLVEIERNAVRYATRAKLQAWGRRPHSGILLVQMCATGRAIAGSSSVPGRTLMMSGYASISVWVRVKQAGQMC